MLSVSYREHKTNAHVRQQVNVLPDIRRSYSQLSTVASYHGSGMYAVMIRYRKSFYNDQWMVVVAEEDSVNEWMDRPVSIVVIAVSRSITTTPGLHGN